MRKKIWNLPILCFHVAYADGLDFEPTRFQGLEQFLFLGVAPDSGFA